MKYITDFLGKPVISLYESNVEGYVKNVVFDKYLKKMNILYYLKTMNSKMKKWLKFQKYITLEKML